MKVKYLILSFLVVVVGAYFSAPSAYAIAIYNKIEGLTLVKSKNSNCKYPLLTGRVIPPGGSCHTSYGGSATNTEIYCIATPKGKKVLVAILCLKNRLLSGHNYLVITGKYSPNNGHGMLGNVKCVWYNQEGGVLGIYKPMPAVCYQP